MESKHTPTPWAEVRGRWVISAAHANRKLGGSTDKKEDRENYAACICITGDNPNRFAEGEPEANAAFIVRAVNSHELLLSALKEVLPVLERTAGSNGHGGGYTARENHANLFAKIDAALALAEEKP